MKRSPVPFDNNYFEKEKLKGRTLSVKETFRQIHRSNHWSGNQSVSGIGSDPEQTRTIQEALPKVFEQYDIKSMLDLPCGDFNWMQNVTPHLEHYTGTDIVPELVKKNQQRFADSRHTFLELDILSDAPPTADLLFCRDLLVHFSFEDITKALENINKSDIPYLMTTTFTQCRENQDITTGDWRIINLQQPPFSLPDPLELINEQCTEGQGTYADKSLGLWEISDLL